MTNSFESDIPRVFNPKDLGSTLKEVAQEHLQGEHQSIVSRWFHSNKDADLFIWSDTNGNVIKQQVTFFGQVVEWNRLEGLKTGLIIEEDDRRRSSTADLIQFDVKPQAQAVHQAIDLIQHVVSLSENERAGLQLNFKKFVGDLGLPESMANEWWGLNLPRPKRTNEALGLWASMKAIIKRFFS